MKHRYIRLTAVLLFALGTLALISPADAVIPAPDGGYPGFNTAEGENALKNLTTGSANTAIGWRPDWTTIMSRRRISATVRATCWN